MLSFLDLLVFLFGLAIGSFLNCVIYRLDFPDRSLWKNLGGLKGRSQCLHCKHNLTWLDLIPVLSFLFLQGKCRYCHKKISIQYPLVEILTGLVFLLIFKYQLTPFQFSIFYFIFSIFLFYIASVLIVIFVYDLKHYLIPTGVLFGAIGIVFLYQLVFDTGFLFFNSIWAAIGAASIFWCLYAFPPKEKYMGFGDVQLVILLGLLLGYPNILVGLFLSFFLGAIIGIILMIFSKMGLKSQVPFAPFLITGTFMAMFWGQQIIHWYLNLFIW